MSKKLSISLFTNELGEYSQSLLNPVIFAYTPMKSSLITSAQNQVLAQIKTYYTKNLADINYKDIPSDMDSYSHLLTLVKQMIRIDPGNVTYCLLIEICMKALTGSLNMYTINERIILDEATIITLNLYIDEILTNKNLKTTINTMKGKIEMKKTMQLSSIYNDYIHFYGLPPFGDGFDVEKLNFLKTYNL